MSISPMVGNLRNGTMAHVRKLPFCGSEKKEILQILICFRRACTDCFNRACIDYLSTLGELSHDLKSPKI